MAKIPRKTQKIFGGALAASGNVAVMGSTVTGTPVYSTDPADIQSLSAFGTGFASQVVNMTNSPVMQEFNAAFLLFTQQLAYLFQGGVAEWDAGTTYYANTSYCAYGNILYRSLQNGNLGYNPASNPTWWEEFPSGYSALVANMATLLSRGLFLWTSTTTYPLHAVVEWGGKIYLSIQAGNLNHSTSDTAWWSEYPAGYQAALSNISNNTSNITAIVQDGVKSWSSTVSYNEDALVRYGGRWFKSLSNGNLNHSPNFSSDTAYWVRFYLDPVGAIQMYAGTPAPAGWLTCSGQVLNIADYPDLGGLLGSTYGGNGVTTFGVPDLRGRVPVGAGTGDAPVATNWQRGRKDGSETVTLTTTQIPGHTHTIAGPQGSNRDFGDVGPLVITSNLEPNGSYPVPANTGSTGGGGSHTNLQPSLGLNFIIKT